MASYDSHFRGISWKVPSGNVLRMVMGKMPASNSDTAMSIGFVFSSASTKIGAPIEICNARARRSLPSRSE